MKKSSNKRNNKKHLTNEGKLLTFLKIAFFVCLNAMSKKCMPKIVKRFDYTQDLLERR
jgi:hypothetical protein